MADDNKDAAAKAAADKAAADKAEADAKAAADKKAADDAAAAKNATKAEVFAKSGGLLRTYDVETHGKDFAKNAQELSDHTEGSTVKLS